MLTRARVAVADALEDQPVVFVSNDGLDARFLRLNEAPVADFTTVACRRTIVLGVAVIAVPVLVL